MLDDFVREITDLSCEVSSLKYDKDLLQKEVKKQKKVIDKAIELLKSQEQDMMGNYFFDDNIAEQLLDILNEVSNE